MFTQLVMLSTIILLLSVGSKALRQSRRTNYLPGKILSFGLFFVAFGIFTYAVRDILAQFGLYQLELTVGKSGIFFHVLGGVLMLRFFTQAFTPERFRQIFFLVSLLFVAIVLIALIIFPTVSEIIQAPFEPFPYKVIKHTPIGMPSYLIMFILVVGSALLTSIVLYNTLKIEEKKLRAKGLLYGMGFLFLFLPSLICLFISPIYARWGYLIGAILLYKGFKKKMEKPEDVTTSSKIPSDTKVPIQW